MNDPTPAISPSIASAVVTNQAAQRRETKPAAKKQVRGSDSIHDTLETSDHGGHSPTWMDAAPTEVTTTSNAEPMPSPDTIVGDGSILDLTG